MDAGRFDSLARQVGTPTSRRAALGATLAGGVLGALGLGRAAPVARAAQRETCVLAFTANVRSGPSASRPLTQGAQPGQLQAQISFTLSETGAIDQGELRLPNNVSVPMVGQATGHSLQLRAALGADLVLVAIGVGEQEIAACDGAVDGLLTGPATGDLGDWHAVALDQDRNGPRSNDQQPRTAAEATAAASATSQGSTQGSSATGSDASSPSCPRGQTFCNREGGYCADLMVDALNCGACGNACLDSACTGGRCATTPESGRADCPPDRAICDGQCVDLRRDDFNCGACGAICLVGQGCANGACVTLPPVDQAQGLCQAGFTQCNGECLDLTSDNGNCGACGAYCEIGQICRNSACVAVVCGGGTTLCGGFCYDTATDPSHCGSCGNACTIDQVCVGGVCTAAPGAPDDGGGAGGEVAPESASTCAPGLTDCGGTCVDTTSSSRNCGSCGFTCPTDQICQNSACSRAGASGEVIPAGGLVCAEGLTDCGVGVCIDLFSDDLNCGACGNRCALSSHCILNVCTPDCPSGGIKCDGVTCVDLQNDGSNCGACGNVCPSGQCGLGICVEIVGGATPTCAPGTTRCGNACVDLSSDVYNCGACGIVCPGIVPGTDDIFCEAGQCYAKPL